MDAGAGITPDEHRERQRRVRWQASGAPGLGSAFSGATPGPELLTRVEHPAPGTP
jgi:hypothetical protein